VTASDFRKKGPRFSRDRRALAHESSRLPRRRKIFATLGYPDKAWAMVKLTPEQQHYFSKDEPDVFAPVNGAWGRRGATRVNLKAARKETLRKAIQAAWQNTAPKRLHGDLKN
jgi:hypothetical protein